jgi:pimeloyl-ACP methyl ester carboxylesterase
MTRAKMFVWSLLLLGLPLVAFSHPARAGGSDEPVTLDTGSGILHGSLRLPESPGPYPVVLLIAGSGPTDRDGNTPLIQGKNNMLRQLAEQLADRGVASLRYDKRGVAASRPAGLSELELRFGHFIQDAVGWCRRLQADERFTRVVVAGHSQGAQVGSQAAWEAGADGLVLMAGIGRPLFTVLDEQLSVQFAPEGMAKIRAIMESLDRGELVPDPPKSLQTFFRPSIQPFLISAQHHDPRQAVALYEGPVTIVQGSTDIQVTMEDALNLAQAQPRARLLELEHYSHMFKKVESTERVAHIISMGDSTLVIPLELTEAVLEVVDKAGRHRQAKLDALSRVLVLNGEDPPAPWPEQDLPLADKVGHWARRFLAAENTAYCFGLADEGYVTGGLLVDDRSLDCVSFVYRCTELARSRDKAEALLWALRTRFNGADLAEVVHPEGWVDYDSPWHLDYSLDMVRSGIWGRNITPELTGAVEGEETTPRPGPGGVSMNYRPGKFHFIPSADLDTGELREGDIVWLVLSPEHPGGKVLRKEHGIVIGHLGVVIREEGQALLVHAAASPLPGQYDRTGVVAVPLDVYLERVDRFAGVMVTRLPW